MISDIETEFKTICKLTGIHDWIKSEKEGTLVCRRCGVFAKVGAVYMRTDDEKYLRIER